ncbi:MAG: response regulator [Hyphomicrobiaceae bacterium]
MPDGVRRIFLVEDEPVLMLELEGAIADMGWQAVPGRGSIANLLKSAQEQSFDAAVLDVNLGTERSDAIADALAARGIPFVYASGYGRDVLPERHRDRPLVGKPYLLGQLRDALLFVMAKL